MEVKDFELPSSSGDGQEHAGGGDGQQVPERELPDVQMDPAVQEAAMVLREPFPDSVVLNGVTQQTSRVESSLQFSGSGHVWLEKAVLPEDCE